MQQLQANAANAVATSYYSNQQLLQQPAANVAANSQCSS